MFSSPLQ